MMVKYNIMAIKKKNKGLNLPSNFPRTLFTAPTHPSHDIPTLRTTVCNHNAKNFTKGIKKQ
jgi:hypothetical protein